MPTEIAGETYWTLDELVALFPAAERPHAQTIRRYIRSGKLHAVKLGRGTLISSSAVRAMLDGKPPPARAPAVPPETTPKPPGRPARVRPNFHDALRRECKRQRAKRA